MCCVFFFQAEDGIRDGRVTGVQTCALPILVASSRARACMRCGGWRRSTCRKHRATPPSSLSETWEAPASTSSPRSGERRVGEERRTRGGAGHLKKKKKERWERERGTRGYAR